MFTLVRKSNDMDPNLKQQEYVEPPALFEDFFLIGINKDDIEDFTQKNKGYLFLIFIDTLERLLGILSQEFCSATLLIIKIAPSNFQNSSSNSKN